MNIHASAHTGVLSDRSIDTLLALGAISCPAPEAGQVQPASMDLRLGGRGYRMQASFLPGASGVVGKIERYAVDVIDLEEGFVLEVGRTYLVELQESLALPAGTAARANPKSSTGRLDVFVRVLTEKSVEFDAIPDGYRGRLWLEIVPKTFPILVRRGSRLSQIRFRRGGHSVLDDIDLAAVHTITPIADATRPVLRNGLCVGIDLAPDRDGVVGWKAKPATSVIDVDRIGALQVDEYWEPVLADGSLCLEPDAFYILASLESVAVPLGLAAEMVPFDAGMGEYRAHYAGFFDPGFGIETPSRAVLEVRVRDVPFIVEHGQTVAKLSYERLDRTPAVAYGSAVRSNYQGQGLKLSKHFAA